MKAFVDDYEKRRVKNSFAPFSSSKVMQREPQQITPFFNLQLKENSLQSGINLLIDRRGWKFFIISIIDFVSLYVQTNPKCEPRKYLNIHKV